MKNTFICSQCKEEFEEEWTKEEALKESKELFPKNWENGDEMVVVCDDCFNIIIGELNE